MTDRGLTRAQRAAARIVLEVLEPDGFCLAGGSALVASGLTVRPTRDIDAFTAQDVAMPDLAVRVRKALEEAGFEVVVERQYPTFASLLVTAGERRRSQFRIDMGQDAIEWPPVTTSLGRTLSPRELVANKLLALFGRVQPRDLVDVEVLLRRFDLDAALADAAVKDPGFNGRVLGEMIHLVIARPDAEWPPETDVLAVRAFGRRLARAVEG